MNSNFSAISSWATTIDNTNIGSAGIYASQIKPGTTAQGTFGSSQLYTFTQALNVPGVILPTPAATPTASSVWIQNDAGSTNGMALNIPASSTNGWSFEVAGTTKAQITADGMFYGTPHSQTTMAPVAPVYTHVGATPGPSFHAVNDIFTTTLNGNCSTNTFCTLTASSVTLTNAAVFAGTTTYACSVSTDETKSVTIVTNSSASTLTVYLWNQSGGTFLNGGTVNFMYRCEGT
jgi:hypothetical protein